MYGHFTAAAGHRKSKTRDDLLLRRRGADRTRGDTRNDPQAERARDKDGEGVRNTRRYAAPFTATERAEKGGTARGGGCGAGDAGHTRGGAVFA